MEEHGNRWNCDKIREKFLPFECERILKVRLNRGGEREEDEWCWDVERDGCYTVKSAYKLLTNGTMDKEEQSDTMRESWLWKKIWKCPVLPRIKVFFWQLCREALATNSNRARRIQGVHELCPNCNSRIETCIHVVRDCGWVGGVWEGLGLDVLENVGFERVREWVEVVMRDASEEEWKMLMVGCWALWERRNKGVFEGVRWCENEVVERVRNLMWEMRVEEKEAVPGTVQEGEGGRLGWQRGDGEGVRQGWKKPDEGWYKLNVDAGLKEGVGVSWGVVCRDDGGEVKWGVTLQEQGNGDPTNLEAEAVLLGLEEAQRAGVKKAIIETDCLIVVEDLKKRRRGRTEIWKTYEAIWERVKGFDSIQFSYTNRKNNSVAHELAHVAPWQIGRRFWTTNVPQNIAKLVSLDLVEMN